MKYILMHNIEKELIYILKNLLLIYRLGWMWMWRKEVKSNNIIRKKMYMGIVIVIVVIGRWKS